MPIRADLRKFYGREWHTVTRPRILDRAGHCCERCKKPNHARIETQSTKVENTYGMIWRFALPRPPDQANREWLWFDRSGSHSPQWPHYFTLHPHQVRQVRVVLTVAHLNHTPGDDRDENLAALCQWCHLVYDLEHHQRTRAERKDQARPLLAPQA